MKVAVIGTGYVGLVTGVCLAKKDNIVYCYDKNPSIISKLANKIPTIYEEDLQENLDKLAHVNLFFSSDTTDEFFRNADVIFLAVGTPMAQDGSADLTEMSAAILENSKNIKENTVVVIKSTVPVGTCDSIANLLSESGRGDIQVVSNPEFLKEGTAIRDFMFPDRIVVGSENAEAEKILRQLYRSFIDEGVPFLSVSRKTSELIKYASNAFLATKIAFINQIADYCEKTGADIDGVSTGVGLDSRIGPLFLRAGPGYGGSCFPKDTDALAYMGRQSSVPFSIVEETIKYNSYRREALLMDKLSVLMQGELENKNVAILGLAFKEKTDDVRYSPAIYFVDALLKKNANIIAHDPMAVSNFRSIYPSIKYAEDDIYDMFKDADVICLLTPWEEYKNLDFEKISKLCAQKNIIDFRGILDSKLLRDYGYSCFTIGRQYNA